LLAIAIAFFLLGFLGISYFLGLSYGDDRAQLVGNHPMATEFSGTTGSLDPSLLLQMQIRFALRHQDALKRLLIEQHNPASASYHKWLKTGEFFQRFGPTKSEVGAVSDWLAEEGFKVTGVSAGYLEFSGSIDQVQRTFAVKVARFGTGDAYGNMGDPLIPARFAGVIGAITGMDNMTHAAPVSQHTNGGFEPNAIINGDQAFGPSDFYTFYDEAPASGQDGSGDCIAIVGTSDFLDSTMTAFTTQFNLPPISYTREVHGANPGINGAEVEAELDLQWAHTAAPGAAIVFHLGGYVVDDISGAVNDNQCGAISISYGFCGPSPAFINGVIDPLFQQAAAQGQSVFVSSGDQGAAGLGYDPVTNSCVAGSSPSVNEMSADPEVTSVGGTQFKPQFSGGNDQGYTIESTWNDESGAGGGGASQIFPKPDYQTGPGVPDDGARDVPDISMMASPNSPGALFGHDMSGTGQVVCCVGGTSLSAPIWAGFSRVLAEISGQPRMGNLNTAIYQLANINYATAGFHDVTFGNNGYNGLGGFNAGPSYDQATGWGTVDFEVFANAVNVLLRPNATPTPTPTSTPTATSTPTPTPQPTGGVLSVPARINFPATATGRPGAMKTLMVRNLSRSTALVLDLGTLASPFSVSGAGHYSIKPGSSVPVMIYFSPANCGTATGSINITSSDPKHSNVTVQVVAKVKGGKLSMPPKVALAAPLSTIATKTVVLKNSGAGMLSGSAQAFGPNSPFSIVGGPVTFWLAPGQKQPVTIQFKPAGAGKVQGHLVIAVADPAATASISVWGSAK
jgi:hypothetical protein